MTQFTRSHAPSLSNQKKIASIAITNTENTARMVELMRVYGDSAGGSGGDSGGDVLHWL